MFRFAAVSGCLVWAALLAAGSWMYWRDSKAPPVKALSLVAWRRKVGDKLMDDSRCLPLRLEGTTLVIGCVNGGNTLYLDEFNKALENSPLRYEKITEEEFQRILDYGNCIHCKQSRPDSQMKTSSRCWRCWDG